MDFTLKIMTIGYTMKNFINWVFCLSPIETEESNTVKKLLNSMRITSKCRYNAAVRLKLQSQFSFFSTTVLSLGLILIPLLQNSDIKLFFSPKVLNMLQIFLAVSILVYSVIIGTARYELRSEALNNCGDKIKDLIRKLRREVAEADKNGIAIDLKKYNSQYDDVSTKSENHSRVDFILASLEMRFDYKYTGFLRAWMYIKAIALRVLPLTIPTMLLFMEGVFIMDMLGVTSIMSSLLIPTN